MRLADKVAIVTGSTRGIGRATAIRFAAEGAGVIITGRSVDEGTAIEQQIRDAGGKATYVRTDLANEDDEPLFLTDAVFEVLQSLLVGGAEVEKLRVRSDVKRHLRESVVALIHRPASIWATREKARQNRVNRL